MDAARCRRAPDAGWDESSGRSESRKCACIMGLGDRRAMSFLDRISQPSDLPDLSMDDLTELARELRERIFAAVSKNGGHLASNLGVVELSIALHYVYEFGPHPTGPDRLLFDVGHQCYAHKMLTGRAG